VNKQLQKIATRIDAMSLRERGILLGAILITMISVWDSAVIAPLDKQRYALSANIEEVRSRIAELDRQSQAIVQRHAVDPDAETRQRLQVLEAELQSIDTTIGGLAADLIPPQMMAGVLEEILTHNTDLTLTRMQSLKARPLLETATDAVVQDDTANKEQATPAVTIYRHSMVIEFTGSYLSTLKYLKALEALPWSFSWDSVEFTVDEYPRAKARIEASTLSFEEAWLGV